MSDYTNLKLSLAMSLQNNMDKETFENEFDGSKAQLLNYLMWGDRHAEVLKRENSLLEEKYVHNEEEWSNQSKQ